MISGFFLLSVRSFVYVSFCLKKLATLGGNRFFFLSFLPSVLPSFLPSFLLSFLLYFLPSPVPSFIFPFRFLLSFLPSFSFSCSCFLFLSFLACVLPFLLARLLAFLLAFCLSWFFSFLHEFLIASFFPAGWMACFFSFGSRLLSYDTIRHLFGPCGSRVLCGCPSTVGKGAWGTLKARLRHFQAQFQAQHLQGKILRSNFKSLSRHLQAPFRA